MAPIVICSPETHVSWRAGVAEGAPASRCARLSADVALCLMRWLVLLSMLFGLTVAEVASAADAGSNKAAAEALFAEARSLMAAGRYAEAIPKLQASQKLDPGAGTLLNLAQCYEQTGKTASAWAEYREVVSMARSAGAAEREEFAQQKARDLEAKLARLAISVTSGGDVSGLKITRDGEPVDPAEFGVPIPVDPGRHVIQAAAPGKQTWSRTIEIGSGSSESVEVPALVDGTAEPAGGAVAAGTAEPAETAQPKSSGSSQRTVALIVGGVGVVGVAVGAVFGLQASSSWDDARASCDDYPYECGSGGVAKAEDASSQATISTIALIAGGACLAGAAVLWFTAGSGEEKQVSVGIGPGSLRVKGSF
jgi:hypothetical protein